MIIFTKSLDPESDTTLFSDPALLQPKISNLGESGSFSTTLVAGATRSTSILSLFLLLVKKHFKRILSSLKSQRKLRIHLVVTS
jgi:hypothetical protein